MHALILAALLPCQAPAGREHYDTLARAAWERALAPKAGPGADPKSPDAPPCRCGKDCPKGYRHLLDRAGRIMGRVCTCGCGRFRPGEAPRPAPRPTPPRPPGC